MNRAYKVLTKDFRSEPFEEASKAAGYIDGKIINWLTEGYLYLMPYNLEWLLAIRFFKVEN